MYKLRYLADSWWKNYLKEKFFFSLLLESNCLVSILQVIAFEWSIAFNNLYNDKLWLCSFLMVLAVKQLVFVSLVKDAFGWRLRSSCFALFSGLSFYGLGKLRYLVDIWWKNDLKENFYIFLFVIWFLWSPMKYIAFIVQCSPWSISLIGLFNLKNSSSELSLFWVLGLI